METDIGSQVLVWSGYRSPVYQAIVFLHYLLQNDFDLQKTGRRVALPLYSEHSSFPYHAIDIGLKIDYDSKQELIERPEYDWMQKNTDKFGFFLSYPENNLVGYEFEPWHWRLMPT
jgi:zinc D-Ala-D-Ala carboxypeptidase